MITGQAARREPRAIREVARTCIRERAHFEHMFGATLVSMIQLTVLAGITASRLAVIVTITVVAREFMTIFLLDE